MFWARNMNEIIFQVVNSQNTKSMFPCLQLEEWEKHFPLLRLNTEKVFSGKTILLSRASTWAISTSLELIFCSINLRGAALSPIDKHDYRRGKAQPLLSLIDRIKGYHAPCSPEIPPPHTVSRRYFFQNRWMEHDFVVERYQIFLLWCSKTIQNHAGRFRPPPVDFNFLSLHKFNR